MSLDFARDAQFCNRLRRTKLAAAIYLAPRLLSGSSGTSFCKLAEGHGLARRQEFSRFTSAFRQNYSLRSPHPLGFSVTVRIPWVAPDGCYLRRSFEVGALDIAFAIVGATAVLPPEISGGTCSDFPPPTPTLALLHCLRVQIYQLCSMITPALNYRSDLATRDNAKVGVGATARHKNLGYYTIDHI